MNGQNPEPIPAEAPRITPTDQNALSSGRPPGNLTPEQAAAVRQKALEILRREFPASVSESQGRRNWADIARKLETNCGTPTRCNSACKHCCSETMATPATK